MIFDNVYTYWVYIALFSLVIMTFQDYFNKMVIGDQRNWFMMGLSFSLLSHIKHSLAFILAYIAVTIVLRVFFIEVLVKRLNLGEGDINTFQWLFMGYMIIGPNLMVWFVAILTFYTLIYGILKKVVFRYDKPTPFFAVITLAFISNNLLFSLF